MEENLHFKIHWPSLIGTYIWRGDLTEGFLRYQFGAHTWMGLFLEFYGILFFIARTLPSFLTASPLIPHTCPHFSSTYSTVS